MKIGLLSVILLSAATITNEAVVCNVSKRVRQVCAAGVTKNCCPGDICQQVNGVYQCVLATVNKN